MIVSPNRRGKSAGFSGYYDPHARFLPAAGDGAVDMRHVT